MTVLCIEVPDTLAHDNGVYPIDEEPFMWIHQKWSRRQLQYGDDYDVPNGKGKWLLLR